jgi:hypothetical protein
MTGYQKFHFSQEENIESVQNQLYNGNKLLYITKRLSGALDTYKYRRQVSMLASLRIFRTVFDCKRVLVFGNDQTLKSSKPYRNIEDAKLGRTLLNTMRQAIYSDKYNSGIFVSSPDCVTETLKYFLRLVAIKNNYMINENLVEELSEIIPGFTKKQITKTLAQISLQKGVVQNTIHTFRNSQI